MKEGPTTGLVPTNDDALPLHVQTPGAKLAKDGECLKIKDHDEVIGEARLVETSQVVLYGAVQVSTQVVQELCKRGIPLVYCSSGGWFYGMTSVSATSITPTAAIPWRPIRCAV
ncbi:MAG: CRISPR-associated endonuclease Cas1 [Nitrospiraceae bacterium]